MKDDKAEPTRGRSGKIYIDILQEFLKFKTSVSNRAIIGPEG
jgi:hypothetical protein